MPFDSGGALRPWAAPLPAPPPAADGVGLCWALPTLHSHAPIPVSLSKQIVCFRSGPDFLTPRVLGDEASWQREEETV